MKKLIMRKAGDAPAFFTCCYLFKIEMLVKSINPILFHLFSKEILQ